MPAPQHRPGNDPANSRSKVGFAPVPATYSLGELGADRRVVAQEDHQHVGSGDDAQDATRLDAPARRTMRPERP